MRSLLHFIYRLLSQIMYRQLYIFVSELWVQEMEEEEEIVFFSMNTYNKFDTSYQND